MKTHRKTAVIVGVLFIIGTVSGILSAVFTGSILGDPNYLVEISANQMPMVTGAFFILLMGLSLAMVPVMMYPLFKKQNEALALGAVVFRGPLEAATYVLMVVSWLLLIVVGQEFTNAGAGDVSQFQALGAVLLKANEVINPVLEIIFSLGAVMFYTLFYQTRLIPRWLSGWGLIGAIVYLATGVLAMFGTNLEFLLALLGVQEMVMALWLIFKGFDPTAVISKTVSQQ